MHQTTKDAKPIRSMFPMEVGSMRSQEEENNIFLLKLICVVIVLAIITAILTYFKP